MIQSLLIARQVAASFLVEAVKCYAITKRKPSRNESFAEPRRGKPVSLTASVILGLIGDTATFVGGLTLAIDALRRETEFKNIRGFAKAASSEALSKITLHKGGLSIRTADDAELAFLHIGVKRNLWGTVILAVGFLFLTLGRIVEIRGQS